MKLVIKFDVVGTLLILESKGKLKTILSFFMLVHLFTFQMVQDLDINTLLIF